MTVNFVVVMVWLINNYLQFQRHSEQRHIIDMLRDILERRSTIYGTHLKAYIVTSFDEHLNENVNDHDKRRQYISGFTGLNGHVVVRLVHLINYNLSFNS